jgi:hypothetical protein
MSFRRRKNTKACKRLEKWQSQVKWQKRARKSSKEQEKLQTKARTQNQHSP